MGGAGGGHGVDIVPSDIVTSMVDVTTLPLDEALADDESVIAQAVARIRRESMQKKEALAGFQSSV